MTKTQAISLQILEHVAAGLTVEQAIDKVCGEGASEKLVSDLYDAFKAKAAR